jgi:hypothetical protein
MLQRSKVLYFSKCDQALEAQCSTERSPRLRPPTKEDLVLFGAYIALYSYIDFNLRRIVEALELVGELRGVGRRAANLNMTEVENAVRAVPELGESNHVT